MQKRELDRSTAFGRIALPLVTAFLLAAPTVARAQDSGAGGASAEPAAAAAASSVSAEPATAPAPAPQSVIDARPEPPPPPAPAIAAAAAGSVSLESAPTEWVDRQGPPPSAVEPPLSGNGDCQNAFSADVPRGAFIDWHACTALDLGYANFTFATTGVPDEKYPYYLGRISVGPVLQHDFGGRYFVRAVGQLVGWVAEAYNQYQVNTDDVYAQVGEKRLWNVQAGRFMTWEVFQKGRGFDLYTLEDLGALIQPPWVFPGGRFAVYKYEVNNIWLRETPGRLAFHVYPVPVFGVELAGTYGRSGTTTNTYGGRGVAVFKNDFLRLAAGAEYRNAQAASTPTATDPNGNAIQCPKCGETNWYGFGGSAVVAYQPIEVGVNGAQSHVNVNAIKDGTHDPQASAKVTTLGGYAQLDVGTLAFHRGLVLGGAWFRTEKLNELSEFERHIQMAAYIYFPLGFNNAGLKLVGSRATEHLELAGNGATFIGYDSAMTAARLRFEYYF